MWTGQDFSLYLDAFGEVYQEADFYAGGFQVVDELGAVCRVKVFYGLEFEDDGVFDNDVCGIVADQLVLVMDLDLSFVFGVEASFFQFDQEGVLVNGFEEAESEGVVDFVGTGDDLMG